MLGWESWNSRPSQRTDYNDFADISKITGFSISALANVVRHIKLAGILMDIDPLDDGDKTEHPELGGAAIADVSAALCILRSQLDARMLDTEYLQERARNQLQVVSLSPRLILVHTYDVGVSISLGWC